MATSLDRDHNEKPNKEAGKGDGADGARTREQSARGTAGDRARTDARGRRGGPFGQDARGRTALFDAAERGDLEGVRRIIYSLPGTGLWPQRLSLIEVKDASGLTAADVAEQAGHQEIAGLLRGEQMRMEYYG